MSNPLLTMRHLSHQYEDKPSPLHAIRDINLDIQKGDFVAVLGPSGCGKSTWLNILAGFLRPTQGEVLIHGKPITKPNKERGVMFQSSTLYPWLSVAENIEFGLKMSGMEKGKRQEVVRKLITDIDLSDFAQARTYELSGGMKQRVALARVLANNPEVILMDEPLGALDAITRHKMQTLIRKLWKERGATVFLITHDIDEALALANKIVIMSEAPGTIEKVFTVNYTYQALQHSKHRVQIDARYIELKEEILDIIEQS